MIEEAEVCAECAKENKDKAPSTLWLWHQAAKRWIFLNIWCRHCYRHVMRLMHKFNLHYAPPARFDGQYGDQHHWCEWCGLRGKSFRVDPNKSILSRP